MIVYSDFEPRSYQADFMSAMEGKKRAVLCLMRRAGKDITCWNYLISQAVKKKGMYFYVFPEFSQARKALWDAIGEDGKSYLDYIPREIRTNTWATEMKVKLANGSIIQVIGSDRYDSARGTNPIGVVLSEYAYQNPQIWTHILDPILTKNGGWAVFNSTPQGRNHFFDLYTYALNNPNDWYVSKLGNDDLHLISQEEIDKKLAQGMSKDLINQEYFCSFEAGVEGSYYGKYITEAEKENRICRVAYDRNLLVYTAWDLGFADSMVIIFFQKKGNEILIIDHYENTGYQLAHYLDILRTKGYSYGTHFIPFDGNLHNSTGSTFRSVALESGVEFTVIPRDKSILEGIEIVRGLMPRMFFDKVKCEFLVKCLLEYHADYDDKAKVYRKFPKHSWASHSADALRYMCLALPSISNPGSMDIEDYRSWKREQGWS
jgi:phage terminase large subunit